MCGISAIINLAGGAETDEVIAARRAQVLAMLELIRHRGDPECFGECHARAGLALGTNRLAIVDRPHAQQPQSDVDGQVIVAYNGELYGYQEIKEELERLGRKFRTASDTEVLVHGYLEWGPDFVKRLNGMFAFVLYDARDNSFMAARDHIGIKPLYHSVVDGTHYFASEQKCLLAHGGPLETVAPGTYVRNGEVVRYFRLDPTPPAMSEDEVVARYRELFYESVKRQVDTDLPVAVMFSGGIDSAAVLHCALKFHPDVTAFTVGFDGAADVAVARRYCEEFGVKHVVSQLDLQSVIAAIPEVVYGTEFFESIDAMDSLVAYFAYQVVHQHGFKVALCGEGSDEVLAGYDLFKTHPDPVDMIRYRTHNLHRTDLQRVDRTSMLSTVETRVPFMDRYLLEFSYGIPLSMKLRDGVEKWVLREAFRGDLPDYIADRPKIRMPDGSGMKNTVADFAQQPVSIDRSILDRLGIDTPQGAYFLKQYLDAGFPLPSERHKRPLYDYSPNGYFEFIS